MTEITNNQLIYINRGDTMSFPFIINVGTPLCKRKYIMKEGDELFFGVMEPHQPFEFALIRKKYTHEDLDENGLIDIELNSSDTICLLPGIYYYEVKFKNEKGIRTLISRRKFVVME